jgi:ACS family hexuronate transporter-like MFS transporter
MIGATLSPPIVAWLYEVSGWRFAFFSTGLLGVAWTFCWVLIFVRGKTTVDLSYERSNTAKSDTVAETSDGKRYSYLQTMTDRKVWAIIIGKMLTYPVWFFYLFWFPKYLTDERGLTVAELGKTVWVTYFAAALGSIVGGMFSGYLIRRGVKPSAARLWVLAFVAVVGPIGIVNGFGPPILISIMVASVVAFLQMFWQINIQVLSTDIFDKTQLVKVISIAALITSLFSVLTNTLVGSLVETISYRPMFVVMAFAYPVAFLIVFVLTREKDVPASKRE